MYNMLNKTFIRFSKEEKDFLDDNILQEYEFQLEEDADELAITRHNYWKAVNDESYLCLTIVTTLACNLNCKYCYESHENKHVLNSDTMQGIIEYIKARKNLKYLHIDWYGGEPILEIDKIVQLSNELRQICAVQNIKYFASINTNLYYFNNEMGQRLIDAGITALNTTLIPGKKLHDTYRTTSDNRPTFFVIYENIKKAVNFFDVTINMNITNCCTIEDVKMLLELLQKDCSEQFKVYFSRVENCGKGNSSIFMPKEVYRTFYMECLKVVQELGIKTSLTSNFYNKCIFCSAQHRYSFLVLGDGLLFKCTERFTSEDAVGYVDKCGFHLNQFFHRNVSDPFNDKKCKSCVLLPYCNGGCTSKRAIGKDYCPEEKDYLDDILRITVDQIVQNW